MRKLIVSLAASALLLQAAAHLRVRRRPTIRSFVATAYSTEGTGASGKWSHPGRVAADRAVLPLNSRIRINCPDRYSGEYTVEDTGGKVDGQHIDVYMPQPSRSQEIRAATSAQSSLSITI